MNRIYNKYKRFFIRIITLMSIQTSTLSQDISNYIRLDDEIQSFQEKLRELKESKSKLHDKITENMIKQNIVNKTISIGSSKLSIIEKKQYSSLTFSYLEDTLSKIIPDQNQVSYVIKYLKENRSIKTHKEIKRT